MLAKEQAKEKESSVLPSLVLKSDIEKPQVGSSDRITMLINQIG